MCYLWLASPHSGAPSAFADTHDETDEKYHDKDEKKDSRDLGEACGDTGKSEDRGDDGDHEKYRGVIKHGYLLF
jgi:hypothetical protein